MDRWNDNRAAPATRTIIIYRRELLSGVGRDTAGIKESKKLAWTYSRHSCPRSYIPLSFVNVRIRSFILADTGSAVAILPSVRWKYNKLCIDGIKGKRAKPGGKEREKRRHRERERERRRQTGIGIRHEQDITRSLPWSVISRVICSISGPRILFFCS